MTVAASGAFGAGATVEEADPADGALEVVAIEAGPAARPREPRLPAPKRQRDRPSARIPHALRSGAVEVPDGTDFNVDGELVTTGEAHFTAVKGAFRLVVG